MPAYTLVNTSGAVLGGDRLRVDVAVGEAQRAQIGAVGATLLNAGGPSFARPGCVSRPGPTWSGSLVRSYQPGDRTTNR